jgi:hypothetical protein
MLCKKTYVDQKKPQSHIIVTVDRKKPMLIDFFAGHPGESHAEFEKAKKEGKWPTAPLSALRGRR